MEAKYYIRSETSTVKLIDVSLEGKFTQREKVGVEFGSRSENTNHSTHCFLIFSDEKNNPRTNDEKASSEIIGKNDNNTNLRFK